MELKLHYFTQEEANALLPTIEPLVAELVDRRGQIVHLSKAIGPALEDEISGVGGPQFSELTQLFTAVQQLIEQIQQHGVVVKDINVGLVDFLANRNGRDVYLCWRYGEPTVTHYHDLNSGYSSRRVF